MSISLRYKIEKCSMRALYFSLGLMLIGAIITFSQVKLHSFYDIANNHL